MVEDCEDLEDCDDDERIAELVELYMEKVQAGETLSPRTFASQYPKEAEELMGLLCTLESVQNLSHSHSRRREDESFPDMLGGYRLIEKIGRGGMGTVFRAMQESLQREVAIKILAPSWNDDERHREAFENESRLIASLRHTNIVEVFGAGQEGSYRYYVMGLVDGKEVNPKLIAESFPPIPYTRAVAELGLQVAKALAFAHSYGVLHRDVKPGNLLLDKNGVVHVSDFGLATVLNSGEDAPLVTMSNDGTLRYMAPERLMKGVSTYAVDQYGLGLSLYELITKKAAFSESEPGQLVRRICEKPITRLQGYGELGAIINKSTSFEPSDRYSDMAAMVTDLQRFLRGEPVQARSVSIARRYRMWGERHKALAIWSHAAALLILLLWGTISYSLISVRSALNNENEQRLLAERNAEVADAAMKRVFDSMNLLAMGQDEDSSSLRLPSRDDIQLMQDLLPYYVEISHQEEGTKADVASANQVLASIALCTGDNEAAEGYFERACANLSKDSTTYMDCVQGHATALFLQNKPIKSKKGYDLLISVIKDNKDNTKTEIRQRVVQCIIFAVKNGIKVNRQADKDRLLACAKSILDEMAISDELPIQRRLLQASLLGGIQPNSEKGLNMGMSKSPNANAAPPRGNEPNPNQMRQRSSEMESAKSLVEEVLKLEPTNEYAMRSFVRMSLQERPMMNRPNNGQSPNAARPNETRPNAARPNEARPNAARPNETRPNAVQGTDDAKTLETRLAELKRSAEYAQTLLATRPDDLELIYLFLSIRSRYTDMLSLMGQSELSNSENERTLGVLSFLSSRAEFSEDLRKQLAMMIAQRPGVSDNSEQREKELLLLMRSFDAKQTMKLRVRINKVKHQGADAHRPKHQQGAGQGGNKQSQKHPRPSTKKPADTKGNF